MKYRIQYNYDTGDSFNNEYGLEKVLEISWNNLEIAKENLQRIKEHYKLYELIDSHKRSKSIQNILREYSTKEWFVLKEKFAIIKNINKDDYHCIDDEKKSNGKIIDSFNATYCIKLKTDEGKDFQFLCPWCGYFEHLNSCKIIAEDLGLEFKT